MGILSKFQDVPENYFTKVAEELSSGFVDNGLWTKTLSECEGDEIKTKALYLKYRAKKLLEQEREKEHRNRKQTALEEERVRNEIIHKKTKVFVFALIKTLILFGLPILVGVLGFKGFPVVLTFGLTLSAIVQCDKKYNGKEDRLFIYFAILTIIIFVAIMLFK